MSNQEQRRYHDSGPRRVRTDRRVSINSDYNGPERRSGKDRRMIVDRRR